MGAVSTPALVIRRADYSDYDRMVTLFTPEYGRIDAIARGCRRPKSPLLNCCEPFVNGEFELFQKGERFSVEQCRILESYYELRTDYDRLCHGVYWMKLLETALVPDVPLPGLFLTTLRALAYLNYSDVPLPLLTMAFELHFMAHLGYSPRMDSCMRCGQKIEDDARFDIDLGGCVCMQCRSVAPKISRGARRIMLKTPRTDFDKVELLTDRSEWPEAANWVRRFVNDRIGQERFAPEF